MPLRSVRCHIAARWVVTHAQQVMMASLDRGEGDTQIWNMDGWAGYAETGSSSAATPSACSRAIAVCASSTTSSAHAPGWPIMSSRSDATAVIEEVAVLAANAVDAVEWIAEWVEAGGEPA